MIFPAGNGKSLSWLDNVAQEKPMGTAGMDMSELRRLAQLSEDVKVEEAVPAEGSPVPAEENVPVAKENPFEKKDDDKKDEDKKDEEKGETKEHEASETPAEEKSEHEEGKKDDADVAIVPETATPVSEESDPVAKLTSALEALKGLLEKGSVDEAKLAVIDALKSLETKTQDVSDDEEVEIPVTVDEGTGEMSVDNPDVVSVEVSGDMNPDADKSLENVLPSTPESNPDEVKCSTMAAGASRFYKIAYLSPDNKKKLSDYWIKALGYDAEWVKDLLTDKTGKKG